MFKQSPSRNNRSKGIKVKHILQICVLLAVCIWLIYQVKHSHEKRWEFEAKDEEVVGKVQTDGEIQRFGRKDIPRITEIDTDDDKHGADEDEKEGEEEENKHEEDELEREDVRIIERDEERGGGDDEIDENEPEKIETESGHEEDAIGDDKEREGKKGVTEENHSENDENKDNHEEGHPEREEDEEDAGKEGHTEPEEHGNVDKEDHSEQEVTSDDQDHDVGRTNSREAQEVLYKADDASSEVAHNVQSVGLETENVTLGHGNEMWGKVSFGQEHENKTSDNAEEFIKPEVQPSEDVNNGTSNATITQPKNYEVNFTKYDNSSHQNSTLPELTINFTAVGIEHSATSLFNGIQLAHDLNMSQNGTIEVPGDKEPNSPGNILDQAVKLKLATDEESLLEASADANKTEIVITNNGESFRPHNTTLASSHATNDKDVEEVAKHSSVVYKNRGSKSEKNGEAGSEESSETHSDEGIDGVQHDPIDASDTTTLIEEEREAKTDLETLPEIRTQNTEDAVAE